MRYIGGAAPSLGRLFRPDEDRRDGSSPVAVISDALWQRRFARAPSIVGQHLVVDGRSLDVVGVMPAHFGGLIGRTDVWTQVGSARWLSGDTGPERPTSRWFEVLTRRRAGVTLEAVRLKMHAIDADGRIYRGMPATALAWAALPPRPWVGRLMQRAPWRWIGGALYHVSAHVLYAWNRLNRRW